MHISDICL